MLYFVQAKGAQGPIKIGYTRDADSLPKRLVSLQTGNDDELAFLGSCEGSIPQEKQLHWRFRHDHHRGEWFKCSRELLSLASNQLSYSACLQERVSEIPARVVRTRVASSNSTCPACRESLKRGQDMAQVGACWVHIGCSEMQIVQGTSIIGICVSCGASIFSGEAKKDKSVLMHKWCKHVKPTKAKPARPKSRSDVMLRADIDSSVRTRLSAGEM